MRKGLGVPRNTERVSSSLVYAVFKIVGCNRLLFRIRNELHWINRGLTTKRAKLQVQKWANDREFLETNKVNKVVVVGSNDGYQG